MSSIIPKTRRKTWYLLPIFLNIVEGIIAYFVIRNDDPKKAKRCLIVGASIFAINIVFGLGVLFLDYQIQMNFSLKIQK